jgi:hypothetical protein
MSRKRFIERDPHVCSRMRGGILGDDETAEILSMNPVRARLVSRAEEWSWSSVRAPLAGEGRTKRLLPAPSQCTVELDQGEGFALLRGYQVQLRRVEVGVVREDLEVCRRSTLVAEAG